MQIPQLQPEQVVYGLDNPVNVTPMMMRGAFNDQQILMAVLSCHKNSAKNHMTASLEAADPNVRRMLLDGAIACNNMAYETFLMMNRMGQYQVPTMHDHTAKTYLHTYQPMSAQMQNTMQ
jgi:spore coat protein CotF